MRKLISLALLLVAFMTAGPAYAEGVLIDPNGRPRPTSNANMDADATAYSVREQ